jgi:hypothetical protein
MPLPKRSRSMKIDDSKKISFASLRLVVLPGRAKTGTVFRIVKHTFALGAALLPPLQSQSLTFVLISMFCAISHKDDRRN